MPHICGHKWDKNKLSKREQRAGVIKHFYKNAVANVTANYNPILIEKTNIKSKGIRSIALVLCKKLQKGKASSE